MLKGSAGAALIESLLAIAVLAAVLPLVSMALVHSMAATAEADFEGMALWILSPPVQELRDRLDGRDGSGGEELFLVRAHGVGGELIGELDAAAYRDGVEALNGRPVRYVVAARLPGRVMRGGVLLWRVRWSVEHPAASPAVRRKCLNLHTCMRP